MVTVGIHCRTVGVLSETVGVLSEYCRNTVGVLSETAVPIGLSDHCGSASGQLYIPVVTQTLLYGPRLVSPKHTKTRDIYYVFKLADLLVH